MDEDSEFEEKILKAMMEPAFPSEDEDPDDKEPCEPEEGSVTPPLSGSAMPTPGVLPAGGITGSPGGLYKWPSTTATTTTGPSGPSVKGTKIVTGPSPVAYTGTCDEDLVDEKPKKRMVSLPPRFTEKVLIAFVDEDNPDEETNVIWAANLEPEYIEMVNDGEETFLQIKLSMEDVYGNRLLED